MKQYVDDVKGWAVHNNHMTKCSIEGCKGVTKTRGMCGAHYERLRKGVVVNAPITRRVMNRSAEDRRQMKAAKNARYRSRYPEKIAAHKKQRHEQCPELQNNRNRRWRKAHPEQAAEIVRRYRVDHPELVKEYPSNSAEYRRRVMLEWIYGPGAWLHWNEQIKKQDGKCSICGKQEKLQQDHEHDTGTLRGALCGCCNAGLGFFREDLDIMLKAIEYLKRWKKETAKAA